MEVTFKEQEIKQLDTIIGEIPAKFAVPLLNVINAVAQRNINEASIKAAAAATAPAAEASAEKN